MHGRPFCFASVLLLTIRQTLAKAAKQQSDRRGLVLGWIGKIYSDILPTPPLNFTESQNCEILTRFSTPVAFDALWFQNETMYRKSKTSSEAQM